MSRDESFLGRWSRRKAAIRDGEAAIDADDQAGAPGVPAGPESDARRTAAGPSVSAAAPAAPPAADDLPSLDTLRGLESDYQAFMQPQVGEGTRRAALKKLFSDPHFNQMDGLDVYIDDYGKFEPMSAAVAASLAVNRYLGVVDHLASEAARIAESSPAPAGEPSAVPDEDTIAADVTAIAPKDNDDPADPATEVPPAT